MSYVLISQIKVQSANLQSCGFLMGGAPLNAASLFAHALARELNTPDHGMILIHHDRQELGEYAFARFYPQQRRGAVFIGKTDYSSKNKYALSLQPTASAHLTISLIIQFEHVDQPEQIKHWLSHARFAGGQVIRFGNVQVFEDSDALIDALGSMPNGFVIQDRHQWLIDYQQQHGINRLDALVQLLAKKDPQRSWLSAAVVGYAALEAPQQRGGVRENLSHAYAEPLVGLVQYISIRQLLNAEEYEEEQPFWTRHWQKSDPALDHDDVFLLKQQP